MINKKLIALLLTCCLTLALFPGVSFANEFIDMPDDWSTEALINAVNNNLLSGYENKIMPQDFITRAQMSAIIVRAFGAIKNADISTFTDVSEEDWFYDSMSKAVYMGAFKGDGTNLNPNDNITREQAFSVIARVFDLSSTDDSILNQFADASDVSVWAQKDVCAVIESGYVAGSNGMLNPKANITRAEFAVVMNRLITTYLSLPEEISELQPGNVMIRCADVSIKNLTTDKTIFIGDGVGDGEVIIENVTANRIVVRGGGDKKIKLINCSIGSLDIPVKGICVDAETSDFENASVISGSSILDKANAGEWTEGWI